MIKTTIDSPNKGICTKNGSHCLILLFVFLLAASTITLGQVDQTNHKNTQVNENATLTFGVPLGNYNGRGLNLPVSLNYSSSVWRIEHWNSVRYYIPGVAGYGKQSVTYPIYSEHSTAGWKSSLDLPKIEWPLKDSYDYKGRPSSSNFRIAEVTIHMPDGSTHELRKGDTIYWGPLDATGTFYAVDGSRMRYDGIDADTGTLYMPDGTRYVLDAGTGQIIDRHGNQMTFNGSTWTDTLGRVIPNPIPTNPQAQDYTYNLPGLAGVNNGLQTYTFKWRELEDALTPNPDGSIPALRVIASHYLPDPHSAPSDSNQSNYPQPQPTPYQSLFQTAYVSYESGEEPQYPIPVMVVGKGQPSGLVFNPVVLTEIVLPDGTSYKFGYNVYGEINKVTYPTGAYDGYDYTATITEPEGFSQPYSQAERNITARKQSEKGDGSDIREWTYSESQGWSYIKLLSIIAPDKTRTEIYKYNPWASSDPNVMFAPFGFGDSISGSALEKRFYSTSETGLGGNILRRELFEYEQAVNTFIYTAPNTTPPYTKTIHARRNPRLKKEVSLIFEGSGPALSQTTTYSYDTTHEMTMGADQTGVNVHHYTVIDNSTAQTAPIAQIPTGNLAKQTETIFLNDLTYRNRNILGLPVETRVLNPANPGDVLAKSQFVYDEAAYFDNNYTTTGWENPNTNLRGNVTTARTWNKDTNTWIESHTMFDNFGNVRKVWDTSGDPTRFVETEYDPVYRYAYPTKTKAPAPDPSGVHGTTEGSEISRVFDFTTGLLLSVTDAKGQIATTDYDNLLRPIRINPPAGGSVSETIYNDTPNNIWVKSRQQIDENNWAESTTFYDNLGRAYKSHTKDLQGDVMSQVRFDNFGRVEKTSNPYRVDANGNPIETVYWSKLRYDEANRVVETFAPAPEGQTGMSLGTVQFGISTLPNLVGTYAVATDASGRKSRAISGIYGLMRVDEATGKGGTIDQDLGTLENPTQPTFYSYNIKGELTKITQGDPNQQGQPIQHRYFIYDSLGRLIRVRQLEQTPNPNLATSGNPENNQWTTGYTYDVLGNVVSVTDAKNITITNFYDKAGRTTKRTYSDGTPEVLYFYDGKGLSQAPQFSRGSLTKVTSTVSEDRFTSFDNHGRLLASQQITDGQTYNFSYRYNLSGALIEEIYPSGRIVRNFLDSDGGLSSVSTSAHGHVKQLASNFEYSANGSVKKMKLGNGLWETAQFNELQQLTQVGLGTTQTNNNLFKVDYEYGELNADGATVDTVKNIGNIAKTTTTIPTTNFVQTFKYDSINRLTEAKETTGATQNWKQTFGYDRFGNRTSFYQIVGSTELPTNNITKPTVDQTNNRFTTGQGYVYDFNGNLIQDAEGRSFTFNGDDKQTEVRDTATSVVIGQYYYDGSGARVKKYVPSTGETTIFVYDAGGALAAEYSTVVEPPTTAKTSYLTTDHLGSPRVITDGSGQVISRRDFMPFGEELGAGVGPRTEAQKYSIIGSDHIRKRFTGYEKDDETGLDFAEARMYQNKHGRFTAPDPLLASANAANPQTFNRYIYTGNNPVNYTDPGGLVWCRQDGSGSTHTYWTGGKQCDSGYSIADGQDVVITQGSFTSRSTNGPAGPGTVVTLNANGTVTVLNPSVPGEAARIADATGARSQAAQQEIISTPAAEVGGTITPRGLLPLPCPPDDSACGSGNVPWSNPLSQGASADEVLDAAQTTLELIGMVPGLEPADAASGLISLARGDNEGFALSVGAMIPIGGQAFTGAKWARRLEKAADTVHGNSLASTKLQNVYRITSEDGLYKIGISGGKTRQSDGLPFRATSQVSKLIKETGKQYRSEVIKQFPNRKAAREYETKLIKRYTRRFGRPPGNPTNR